MAKIHGDLERDTEPINLDLKKHQVTADDWEYHALVADLHTWAARFCGEFKLQTPVPALAVERLRRDVLGHFRPGRNGWGLKWEVVIDKNHATSSEYWQVLGTLLHEQLHIWQDALGTQPSRSNHNYHNRQMRSKAASLGLIVDRWGHTRFAPDHSPFLEILKKHGVKVPALPPVEDQEAPAQHLGTSKLKLWICDCPVRVRVAVRNFRARCLVCGAIFRTRD